MLISNRSHFRREGGTFSSLKGNSQGKPDDGGGAAAAFSVLGFIVDIPIVV